MFSLYEQYEKNILYIRLKSSNFYCHRKTLYLIIQNVSETITLQKWVNRSESRSNSIVNKSLMHYFFIFNCLKHSNIQLIVFLRVNYGCNTRRIRSKNFSSKNEVDRYLWLMDHSAFIYQRWFGTGAILAVYGFISVCCL